MGAVPFLSLSQYLAAGGGSWPTAAFTYDRRFWVSASSNANVRESHTECEIQLKVRLHSKMFTFPLGGPFVSPHRNNPPTTEQQTSTEHKHKERIPKVHQKKRKGKTHAFNIEGGLRVFKWLWYEP